MKPCLKVEWERSGGGFCVFMYLVACLYLLKARNLHKLKYFQSYRDRSTIRVMWTMIEQFAIPMIHGPWQLLAISGTQSDVGEQHCPCPVFVSFLSGFPGKSCPVSVCCLDFVRILCPVSVCPDFFSLDSVRWPDSVRILEKALRCLSVRSEKDETELYGLSLTLSADVWTQCWAGVRSCSEPLMKMIGTVRLMWTVDVKIHHFWLDI